MQKLNLILTTALLVAGAPPLLAQPVITQQPANLSVSLGATAQFSVTVSTNSLPVTYQWQRESSPIPGATQRILSVSNAQPTSEGNYSVIVSNPSGSVTSDPARLSVDPLFTTIKTGPVVTEPGLSSGCSWGDYDNDGHVDLFVARGRFADSVVNLLYRNNGDGSFTRMTSGLVATDPGNTLSGTWVDYDSDGFLDLFVARSNNERSALYRNLGDGSFQSVPNLPFASRPGYAQAGAWADFDNDGRLDLFLTGRNGLGNDLGAHNALYQNLGNNVFLPVLQSTFRVLPSGNYRPGVWSDYDNDGDMDIFLCNFFGGLNFLFRNDGDAGFVSVGGGDAVRSGVGSRGAAWADYDNDGDLDLFVANGFEQLESFLYQNNGDGTFTQLPSDVLGRHMSNSAYAAWGDYDNDGFIDLFVPNGERTSERNSLYRNNGDGSFSRVETGSLVSDVAQSVTCGWADYDNNGFLDLFVGNIQGQTNFLYRNNGNANHWLKVKLEGTTSNRSGIGAKIRATATIQGELRTQLRQISTGNGHDGGHFIAHFGLGNAATVDSVRVEWPSGKTQELKNVAVDRFLTITEPADPLPLQVRTSPRNVLVGLRERTQFYATVSGPAPVAYQWMRDGQPLAGQTGQILTLTNVQSTSLGEYTVAVSAGGTTVTSKPARITLDPFSRVPGSISELGGSRGGAWADYDNDNDLDILVWNGGDFGKVNYLFRNDGNSVFTRITEGPVATDNSDHFTAAWGDYDNDGFLDLFTTHWDGDPNDLFRNNGDGTFAHVGTGSLPNDFGGFAGAAWADYNNDGRVDFFFGNALGRPNSLYRNEGNGVFARINTGELAETGGDARGAAWSDYDNDGFIDLFMARGNGMNLLFNNLGNGTFVTENRSSVATTDALTGIWGDIDNDSLMDLLVISPGARNILFRNTGAGVFRAVTNPGIANEEIVSIGAAFGDYDNDGLLDVFVAGGGRNALFRNIGSGRFTPVLDSQVMVVDGRSFGCSWADFDNDGFLDLFVANGSHEREVPNSLFRNNGNTNRWVKFKLVGGDSNRTGLGAKIHVLATIRGTPVTQKREITGGSGFGNSQPLEAHFGLGDAAIIDTVRIEWPSKKVQELQNVAVNQFLTIREPGAPAGAPRLSVTGGAAELTFVLNGDANATYTIQVSQDLQTWTTLTTVTASASGSASFTDRPGAAQPLRFFRALRP